MEVTVNGTQRHLAEGQTLADLLAELGAAPEHVAVEHNGAILDRADFPGLVLRPADRLEIVRFVGGG